MRYISCNINLFTQWHTLYLHEGEQTKILGVGRIDQLPQIITGYCNQENVDIVHLIGLKVHLKPIAEEIVLINKAQYGHLDIKVEVN